MKYLIAQGLKKRSVFKKRGALTGFEPDRNVNMLGEGVKKIYLDGQGQGQVMRKPLMAPKPLKPLKFRF